MAFSWGAALTQFGKDLPTVGTSIDDIFEKKRQAKKDELKAKLDLAELEKSGLNISNIKDALARRDEGRAALGRYETGMENYEALQKERMPEPSPDRIGPLTTREQGAMNTNALIDKTPTPDFSKLVPFESYTPEIKSMIDYELANKKLDSKISPVGINATPFDPNTPEYKFAEEMVKGNLPLENAMTLYTAMSGNSGNRSRLLATAYKIDPNYSAIGSITGKAGAIKTATNLALEKPSEATVKELSTAQGIFANLDNAREKFKSNFATPFAGKVMKLGYLRRTNPAFADFISSLGLAMNEYRRQNFGTAQTASEIQNFLDVLNTDTDITPEAFTKQLDNVTSSMQRDYGYKTKNLAGAGYKVPESAKGIKQETEETKTVNGNVYRKVANGWQRIK
jgi:hypothetical protein